jgi:hypothetical protein
VFQQNLISGQLNAWQCRAGARYLYVCEDGRVHWCSQQRGYPAIPLAEYSAGHLEREYSSVKSCAPSCTVSCVHRVGLLDELREKPLDTLQRLTADRHGDWQPPRTAKLLTWMFVTSSQRHVFRRLALRAFKVEPANPVSRWR